jgi:hypothetical protein
MVLLLLLLVFMLDLVFRLWLPVTVSSQSAQAEVPELYTATRVVPASLLAFYQQGPQSTHTETATAEKIPVDAKQIGNYVVELFGIYSQAGQYKAMLRVQPDSDAGKRLLRVGVGPLNADLTLTTLSADALIVSSSNQTITLQLFNKKQLKQAAD